MANYKTTIGLEIHAQLKTESKMFCSCKNDPDEKIPNKNICPICTGHPGTLPTANKEAILNVLKVGCALESELADFTQFDRKHYFYPDIPKGYQISQYKNPLASGGELVGVKITRVHLEEDTARSIHEEGSESLIDFNRSGIPLMELVTEPVIESGERAGQFARELQRLLRALDVSDANMEKGQMRVEANLSVSDSEKLGAKVEIKNLNSFRSLERAVAYEIERHTKLLENGESIIQETRGWDEEKGITVSQRKKEESHDYRYFPEPDIPPFKLSEIPEFRKENILNTLPELPDEKKERYIKEFGIKEEQVNILIDNPLLAELFENTLEILPGDLKNAPQKTVNYITSDIVGLLNDSSEKNIPFPPKDFALLIEMICGNELSSRGGKDVLSLMFKEKKNPKSIAEEYSLLQVSNEDEINKLAEEIIKENPEVVSSFKSGKESSLQFLIGQGMKKSKGSADPGALKEVFLKFLKG